MRLAVLSDIHGNLPALEAVLDDLGDVDLVVDLGDIASGPLWPAETVELLMPLAWPTLAGNHERQVLEGRGGASDEHARQQLSEAHKAWFRSLPSTRWIDDVLLCHATPTSDLAYWLESLDPGAGCTRAASREEILARAGIDLSAASLVLCGHTHVPRCVSASPHTLIVNPGSVGLPAYDDSAPWPHVVEVGSPHARYAIVERRARGWQVQQRQVVYDWERAAARAEDQGRPEWARALRSGRVA